MQSCFPVKVVTEFVWIGSVLPLPAMFLPLDTTSPNRVRSMATSLPCDTTGIYMYMYTSAPWTCYMSWHVMLCLCITLHNGSSRISPEPIVPFLLQAALKSKNESIICLHNSTTKPGTKSLPNHVELLFVQRYPVCNHEMHEAQNHFHSIHQTYKCTS